MMWSWHALAAVAVLCSHEAVADQDLTFGVYASDKPSAMVEQLRPTLDLVAKAASNILAEPVKIRLQVVRDYEEGVRQIVDGKVDFSRIGAVSYVAAKEANPGLHILAVEKIHGAKLFYGVICVAQNSDIVEVSQLHGRSFAFGDKDSTLGRYFAQLYLTRAGIRDRDLARYEYLGRHDKVGAAVGSGLFDAGSLEETSFNKLVASGTPIRAIARFPNATKPWVARAGLDGRVQNALRQALLGLADHDALTALRFDGFLPGDDSDYDLTRAAMKENPRFFETAASEVAPR